MDDIVFHKAKIMIITDNKHGAFHWAAAITCSAEAWRRVFLTHLQDPTIVKLGATGAISKTIGAGELVKRRDEILTFRIARAKRGGSSQRSSVLRQPPKR